LEASGIVVEVEDSWQDNFKLSEPESVSGLRGTGESLWYSANLSATAGLSEAEVRRGCGSTGTGFGLLLRLMYTTKIF